MIHEGRRCPPFREDRFFPQNEADYERLAHMAAAEAAGTDLLLDERDIELYAHVSCKTVCRLAGRGLLPEKRVDRNIRVSKRALDVARRHKPTLFDP